MFKYEKELISYLERKISDIPTITVDEHSDEYYVAFKHGEHNVAYTILREFLDVEA